MNSSLPTRKSVWNSSLSASLAALVLVAGVVLRDYPAAVFSIAAVAALLGIMLRDYGPRRRRWEPRRQPAPAARESQRCPLAA